MAHTLSWYTPHRVLCLTLEGQLSIEELQEINLKVMEMFERQNDRLNIVIDATSLKSGYNTSNDLRSTQKYMNHHQLDTAFVVAENKINRLITLMAFSISRAKFLQFRDWEKATDMLSRSGFANTQIK
ncbi:MAG: hypothetical protein Q9P01_07250 [Anaerolineae bacterium]|nr:hypothetical protein [Anaerolineae bacterium]MDQ7034622.1 hypothetical protein [Anaerolineae bacterium]